VPATGASPRGRERRRGRGRRTPDHRMGSGENPQNQEPASSPPSLGHDGVSGPWANCGRGARYSHFHSRSLTFTHSSHPSCSRRRTGPVLSTTTSLTPPPGRPPSRRPRGGSSRETLRAYYAKSSAGGHIRPYHPMPRNLHRVYDIFQGLSTASQPAPPRFKKAGALVRL